MISIVLRNICDNLAPIMNFKIYVCLDGSIFMDEIEKLIDSNVSVLVLVPIRLGLDNIQNDYLD